MIFEEIPPPPGPSTPPRTTLAHEHEPPPQPPTTAATHHYSPSSSSSISKAAEILLQKVESYYTFIYETKHSKSGLGLPSIVALVMTIDKSWTTISNRNSDAFLDGLFAFIKHCEPLYIRGKPNGKLIWKSIQNGPTPHPMITDPPPTDSAAVPAPREKLDSEFSKEENKLEMADTQAEIILSQGLPRHIFNNLNQTSTAKEIWDNVEMLMQGSVFPKAVSIPTHQQPLQDFSNSMTHATELNGTTLVTEPIQRKAPGSVQNPRESWTLITYKDKALLIEAKRKGDCLDSELKAFLAMWNEMHQDEHLDPDAETEIDDNTIPYHQYLLDTEAQNVPTEILSEKKDLADSYLDEIVCLKNANKVARDILQRFNMPTETIPMLFKKPKRATADLHKDLLGELTLSSLDVVQGFSFFLQMGFTLILATLDGLDVCLLRDVIGEDDCDDDGSKPMTPFVHTRPAVNEVHSNDNQIFDNVDYQLSQDMHQEEHLDSDAETEIDDNTIPLSSVSSGQPKPIMFPTEGSADHI
ncbi:hypothetical protein Tco_0145994 [Tanacetum coccineum]